MAMCPHHIYSRGSYIRCIGVTKFADKNALKDHLNYCYTQNYRSCKVYRAKVGRTVRTKNVKCPKYKSKGCGNDSKYIKCIGWNGFSSVTERNLHAAEYCCSEGYKKCEVYIKKHIRDNRARQEGFSAWIDWILQKEGY